MAPRDAEEKRIGGGAITTLVRDQEIARITGKPITSWTPRDSEEGRKGAAGH